MLCTHLTKLSYDGTPHRIYSFLLSRSRVLFYKFTYIRTDYCTQIKYQDHTRYDGKPIFVVRVLKDIDTGESIVVCKDASFSKEDNEHYYLIRYTSFCEQVEVDGVLRDKYVRQTRREIDEGTVREVYEDGFPEPKSKPFTYVDDEYVERAIRCSRTYHEYAKDICENYRMDLRRYKLIRERKQYIGISNREAYQAIRQMQSSSQRRVKMHKLDPIERLPDGSLFRLTPGQLRSVHGLTKRCCNFLDGDCLLLDGVCPQHISRSLLCRWFRRAVLPQQPKLEQAILSPKKLRRCEVCGTGILARSGRAKYCPACAKEVHRQQKAKSARKRRTGVDNSGAKNP